MIPILEPIHQPIQPTIVIPRKIQILLMTVLYCNAAYRASLSKSPRPLPPGFGNKARRRRTVRCTHFPAISSIWTLISIPLTFAPPSGVGAHFRIYTLILNGCSGVTHSFTNLPFQSSRPGHQALQQFSDLLPYLLISHLAVFVNFLLGKGHYDFRLVQRKTSQEDKTLP
jgi:hypothetical protein